MKIREGIIFECYDNKYKICKSENDNYYHLNLDTHKRSQNYLSNSWKEVFVNNSEYKILEYPYEKGDKIYNKQNNKEFIINKIGGENCFYSHLGEINFTFCSIDYLNKFFSPFPLKNIEPKIDYSYLLKFNIWK